jgi:DNA-binding response OmpR family regulator
VTDIRGTVLLVDDAASLRSAYRLILEARGLAVREAASAREAVDEIHRERPDAVVADLGLPDSSGIEAVRRIREAAPDVPLLILTGTDRPELRSRCRRMDVDDYRVKPLAGTDLAERIESLLRCSGG